MAVAASGCGGSVPQKPQVNRLEVNSTTDATQVAEGTVTLRSAIEAAGAGETVTFSPALDGATIQLSIVGENHTPLMGEVYAGGPPTFQGYTERDYGKSAIYVRKSVSLDASKLPSGVTIAWTGGDANPARVLAVYGDLTLKNIRITGGYSKAETSSDSTQQYTLARGGGLAVWGTAFLEACAVYGNRISGDLAATRDRGAYGGGIYANGLNVKNCVISGNIAEGYGAAGGGIYSVGGADHTTGTGNPTLIAMSSITGNRVTAQHAYGGGVFTLSGGPTNLATMQIMNSTVARNLVEDNPSLPESGQYYYRGGGVYIGGGSLTVLGSTIAENEVRGVAATFSNKPNVGGGGIAATIGDAHVVENLTLQQSIIAGNLMNGAAEDVFTGSLLMFYSNGYNLLGALDFRYILVPVPNWKHLSRKHYPKAGDADQVSLSEVVELGNIEHHANITSAGTDAGQKAVLWYMPRGVAIDKVPANKYEVTNVAAGYTGYGLASDDFLNHAVQHVSQQYSELLGPNFGSQFGDLTGVTWYGPLTSWPSNPANQSWITFWRNLDAAIGNKLGVATLGDEFWGTFTSGPLCQNVSIAVQQNTFSVTPMTTDARGLARPRAGLGDVGAVER